MVLQASALDALVGGVATAFFGGLLAGGAYLLKQLLVVKDDLRALSDRLDALASVETSIRLYGDEEMGNMGKGAKAISRTRMKGGS